LILQLWISVLSIWFLFVFVDGYGQGNGVEGVARNAIALAGLSHNGSSSLAALAALRVCSLSLIRELAAMLLC
jgi:hypothetical protein